MEKYGIKMGSLHLRAWFLHLWLGDLPNGWGIYLRDRDMNPRYSIQTRERI